MLYPTLVDKESGYVKLLMDPAVFPVGLRGVMIAAFAAAYMSTVATQLATLLLMAASCVVTYFQTNIEGAWKLLMAIGAGTGSVLILRWFWWRINAWSEVAAMAASLATSLLLQYGFHLNPEDPRQLALQILISVGVTTAAWLAATFLTAPEPEDLLLAFYRRVRPSATLWGPIAAKAGLPPQHELATAFLDWIAGCVMVYLALFGVGKCLFGGWGMGLVLLGVSSAAGVFLYRRLNRRRWHVVSD